jgi:hypothetical protein
MRMVKAISHMPAGMRVSENAKFLARHPTAFELCARWSEVRSDLRSASIGSRSADGIRGDALYGQLSPQTGPSGRQPS